MSSPTHEMKEDESYCVHEDRRFKFDVGSNVKSYDEYMHKYQMSDQRITANKNIFLTKRRCNRDDSFCVVTKIVRYYTAKHLQLIIQHAITKRLSLGIEHSLFKGNSSYDIYIVMPLFSYALPEAILSNKNDCQRFFDKNGKLLSTELNYFILDIASELYQLHNNNYVHLDIKPSNIMYKDNYKWCLIDFDTMKYINPKTKHIKHDDHIGTMQWTPPEIDYKATEKCPNIITKAADIWAFALCINFILAKGKVRRMIISVTKKEFEKSIYYFYDRYFEPFRKDNNSFNYAAGDIFIDLHLKEQKSDNIIDDNLYDLLGKMLRFDPKKRISAKGILGHKLLKDIVKKRNGLYFKKQRNSKLNAKINGFNVHIKK